MTASICASSNVDLISPETLARIAAASTDRIRVSRRRHDDPSAALDELRRTSLATVLIIRGPNQTLTAADAAVAAYSATIASSSAPQPAATASETHVTGLNYMKSGSDPELGPDDAYPEWLWTLSETKESLGGYERRIADLKAAGLDWRVEFSEEDAKRYKKLERTNRIRTNNAERKKG